MSSKDDESITFTTTTIWNLRALVFELYQRYHIELLHDNQSKKDELATTTLISSELGRLMTTTTKFAPPGELGPKIYQSAGGLSHMIKDFRQHSEFIDKLFFSLLGFFSSWASSEESDVVGRFKVIEAREKLK
jgi:hypothetical protein